MKIKRILALSCIMLMIFNYIFIAFNGVYAEENIIKDEVQNETDADVDTEIENEVDKQENENIEKEEINEVDKDENILEDDDYTEKQDLENREIEDEKQLNIEMDSIEIKSTKASAQKNESSEISDGIYYIQSAINSKEIFDIENVSQLNNAKLQLWEKPSQLSDNQKFEIKNLGDGYYTIQAKHSGKVLDVAGAGTNNGTKVQQYANNGTDAQKWIIKDTGDEYVNIISKCNGLYLDIPGANASNGTKMQVYEGNDSLAQKFKLSKIEEIVGEQTIVDGTYKIKTSANSNIGLDIASGSKENEANVQLWTGSNIIAKNQRFIVTYEGNGYYEIKAEHSDKVLDVAGGSTVNGSNVQQYEKNGTDAQKWIIKDNGDQTYSIISKKSGLYLDVKSGNITDGSNIQIYEGNETEAQKFKFEKVEKPTCKQVLKNGIYKINTQLNPGMYLDISEGSYGNTANLQIWEKSAVQQQKFKVTYNEDGYYEIKCVHSGKVLDVYGGSNKNGANVQQYEVNNTEYQKWVLQSAGNGYYYIISKGAENYLDVAGGSSSNGTNVRMYGGNQSASQKFKFESVQIIEDDEYNVSIEKDSSQVLDIDLASSNLQIWTLNLLSKNQRFEFKYLSDGSYKIICNKTQEVLTLKDNNNVVQESYNNTDNQKWVIEPAGNGYYYIKSKSTNLYLNIQNNAIKNGANIIVDNFASNTTKFKFNTISIFYGIDVSEWNGLINWIQVKGTGKVDFAMIRAGYRGYGSGRLMTDPLFERNLTQANAMGIKVGVYFFTQAITEYEAREEVDYLVSILRRYDINIKYPVAIDTEYSGSQTNGENDYLGRADNLNVTERTAVCGAFCERLKEYGYTPMIYASRDWFYYNLDVSQINAYEHWVAHYTGSEQDSTDYKYQYTMWQYTSRGLINGILGNVDLNIGRKKY